MQCSCQIRAPSFAFIYAAVLTLRLRPLFSVLFSAAIRLVKAFQYAATHVGEVCPASWQPGQKTIHANPDGIRDYFRGEKDL